MGHLSRWKDDQRSASFQPHVRRPQPGAAASVCGSAAERIDEEAELVQLWNAGKQPVGQQPDVGSHAPENRGQRQTVNRSVRVIRRYHERTVRGNGLEVRRGPDRFDVECR